MGQVTAVGQAHGEHGLTGHDEGPVRSEIGARPTMGLEVGMVGAKKFLGARNADFLGHINFSTTTVIPPAGVSLGVLITQCRAERRQNGR